MESRAHCVGFSVMEIGNRKERLRDYASFPDKSLRQVWAAAQNVPPNVPFRHRKARARKMARPAFPVAYFFSNFSLNRSALSRI